MSANSKIEWTDHTFNPWIGCTKVSPACDHCYAEVSTPSRTLGVTWGAGQPRRRTSDANWALPERWNAQAEAFHAQHGRRQRVFCASLADVFDNEVDPQWRHELFALIKATPNLDWLLLTKRIGNASKLVDPSAFEACPNIWLGATICNQEEADRDIPKLLAVPARVRFLSIEPLLERVNLHPWLCKHGDASKPEQRMSSWCTPAGQLHWVIVGGESGHQARPMHPDWARSLRVQCAVAGVPFLFKQWGEWLPMSHQTGGADPEQRQCHIWPDGRAYDGEREEMTPACAQLSRVGKKAAGRLLDGVQHDGYPA